MLTNVLALRRSTSLLRELAARESAPKNIQLTPAAGGYYASVFDRVDIGAPISEQVSVGFSKIAALAVLKGLVEWLERQAFRQGAASGITSCQTARSDGIAGYPLSLQSRSAAKKRARANAYAEAVERYVWSTWWDRLEIGYDRYLLKSLLPGGEVCTALLSAARQLVDIKSFEVILPHFDSNSQADIVIIFLAHLSGGGILTGGAAGLGHKAVVWERAASELFRHCLALRRMLGTDVAHSTFYQRRLFFFGSGVGREIVSARLARNGTEKVLLSQLRFDEEIQHTHSDLVYVHRCLFDNQPLFMAGNLERLCI